VVYSHIVEWLLNSYLLKTTEGTALPGEFSARRLRLFIPREGTDLFRQQLEVIGQMHNEGMLEGNTPSRDLNSELEDNEADGQIEGAEVERFSMMRM